MKGLQGKIAIVTGGAGGIGAAICRRLAEEGAQVAIFDLNAAAASALAESLVKAGGTVSAHAVDITDYAAVESAVAHIEDTIGPVDVLVNNAGWDKGSFFLQTDRPFWDKVVAINLYGPLNLHHVVLKRMDARGRGRVVNISSDAGRVGSSLEAVYSFCKGGIIAFSKTMAREMARKQICINVVCPGPTSTPLLDGLTDGDKADRMRAALVKAVPFGRVGEPDDIAGAVCFLASEDAAFVTGQVLSVSGGLTMVG